jgi:hypothetical protein
MISIQELIERYQVAYEKGEMAYCGELAAAIEERERAYRVRRRYGL